MSNFWKTKTLYVYNYVSKIFDISELFIQCNIDSCCDHIAGAVNTYLYRCVSLLVQVCFVCVCACACACVCLCV